jgi:hypothetical protein
MSDIVTGALLIAIIVGAAVGAVSAQILSPFLTNGAVLAIVCGFVGVVGASLARNALLHTASRVGGGHLPIPSVIILMGMVSSVAGSLSAYYLTMIRGHGGFAWEIGAVAGLFSSLLMGLLIIAYLMDPTRAPKQRTRRVRARGGAE